MVTRAALHKLHLAQGCRPFHSTCYALEVVPQAPVSATSAKKGGELLTCRHRTCHFVLNEHDVATLEVFEYSNVPSSLNLCQIHGTRATLATLGVKRTLVLSVRCLWPVTLWRTPVTGRLVILHPNGSLRLPCNHSQMSSCSPAMPRS